MDEQRLQDYLNLVQALLSCRSEEKLEVLQHHRNLVDQGLVWVMEQVAEMMSQKGNQRAADWLRDFAVQLAAPIQNWEQLNQRVVQLYQQGEYRQATMFAEQAMALARKLWGDEHPNIVTSFNNLARLYEAQGRFAEAEPLHKEALAMSKRLFPSDHPLVSSSLSNLAGFYESQGHLSDAEPLYEEALKMSRRLFLSDDHPLVATSLNNLAELYHLQGRLSDAESLHEEALGMRKRLFPTNHLDVATSLNNLAALYQSGEAIHIDRLIHVFRKFASDGIQAVQSLDMGGDDEEDEDLKQQPAEVIQLREAIFDPIRPYLDSRQHLLLAPDGNLNLVPFQILPTDETGKTLLMDEYRISYLSVGRDILRSKIQTKRSASQPLVIADPDFDLTDTGAIHELPLLQPAEELLQTFFQRAKGTRFLGEEVAKKLGVSPYLDKEALASRLTNCQSPSILLIATHGYFSEWLQDCVKLIAALLICSNGDEVDILDKNPKLIEPKLLEMIEKAAAEFARTGHQNIADRLRNFVMKAAAIIDESTQTTSIQPPNSKLQNQKDPMLRSALAFAGANTWLQGKTLPNEAGKGLVFAHDVAALDLWATELAVLCACQTGIGDIKIGEGVFGLRRAFAVAGAKTLVMSLWSVPDRATALLMQRFFTNLQQGLGRADALQDAQNYIRTITVKQLQQSPLGRSVLDELVEKKLIPQDLHFCQDNRPLEHPYFWGAWVCQGDTTTISSSQIMK